uniref:LigA n=1 Tax=Parastrongyloides trichosuri TaxID=131310 RepID=A0A0N4ZDA9_PARTI
MRCFHGIQCFGQCADLVHFNQNGIGNAHLDTVAQTSRVGHEQIIADQLHLVADPVGQQLPAVPVVLGAAVLDRDDREALDQVGQVVDHALGVEGLALAGQLILAVLEELGRGDVQRQVEVLARQIAGRLARLGDEGQGFFGRGQIWCKTTFVTDVGVVTGSFQGLLQGVEDFRAHAQGFREALGAHRQDHEFLKINRVIRMCAAVDDVHHWHRQDMGVDAADIAVERQAGRNGAGLGHGQRHAQHGVGAQARLVLGAVQFDQGFVDAALVLGVHAGQGVEDLAVDGVDRLLDALAAIAALSPSRSSTASCAPVDAPLGTAARPKEPSSSVTSTSTVGLPRLSRISRPTMSMMSVMKDTL